MLCDIKFKKENIKIDLNKPIDISIPIKHNGIHKRLDLLGLS